MIHSNILLFIILFNVSTSLKGKLQFQSFIFLVLHSIKLQQNVIIISTSISNPLTVYYLVLRNYT